MKGQIITCGARTNKGVRAKAPVRSQGQSPEAVYAVVFNYLFFVSWHIIFHSVLLRHRVTTCLSFRYALPALKCLSKKCGHLHEMVAVPLSEICGDGSRLSTRSDTSLSYRGRLVTTSKLQSMIFLIVGKIVGYNYAMQSNRRIVVNYEVREGSIPRIWSGRRQRYSSPDFDTVNNTLSFLHV